jgi:CubicO group peptidase (beta-lactamase class C family)
MTASASVRASPRPSAFRRRAAPDRGGLRREVEDGQIPGAVVGITRGGKLAHLEASAIAMRGTSEPLGTDAIFSIASMTKPMTSTGCHDAGGEGRVLLLGDPVANYLPPLAALRVAQDGRPRGRAPEAGRRPFQDLLRHTSG